MWTGPHLRCYCPPPAPPLLSGECHATLRSLNTSSVTLMDFSENNLPDCHDNIPSEKPRDASDCEACLVLLESLRLPTSGKAHHHRLYCVTWSHVTTGWCVTLCWPAAWQCDSVTVWQCDSVTGVVWTCSSECVYAHVPHTPRQPLGFYTANDLHETLI